MMYKIIRIGILVLLPFAVKAQVAGVVQESNKNNNPLFGANVFWQDASSGTISNENGSFEIDNPKEFPAKLIVSYIGFISDTVLIETENQVINVSLEANVKLDAFELTETESGTKIDLQNPLLVETLSQKEFQKAACCNISESFETNASVDVNFTDAVSGTKKIQMLGLDGIYTQIQGEMIPMIRGLSSAFGLTYVPGTWAESIQIKKGAGSVVNGYESITGQINVEMLKPDNAEKLFVNIYGNERGRGEVNIHGAQKINDKLSTMTFAHVSSQPLEWDNNNDGFMDMPVKTQYNLFNRWKYKSDKYVGQVGVKGVYEELNAGQISTIDNEENYKINVSTKQVELFNKNGFLFPKTPYKSVGIIGNLKYHDHKSTYGLKTFNATQTSGYLNAIFQTMIWNTDNKIKMGASFVYDNYSKLYNGFSFDREEIVPGVFTEYDYTNEKTAIVLGVRGDYHNLYGAFVSPRFHYKYNFTPLSAVRLSAGRGYRVANPLIENAAVMASSRVVSVDDLLPEIAMNYGTSITHKFEVSNRDVSANVDYYYTDFENQIVVDIENPDEIAFYNLSGKSFSHSFQAELTAEITQQIELKTAYKWYNIQTEYKSGLKSKPLVPTNRILINVGYATNFDKWKFDLTGQWFGVSRLPSTENNLPENRVSKQSEAYFTLNGQVTKKFKKFDVYLGVENMTNYRQNDPIVAANDPFGADFDASMIWGPVNGRIAYAGLRYSMK